MKKDSQANQSLVSQVKAKYTIQANIKTYHAVYNIFTDSQANQSLARQVKEYKRINSTNKHTAINLLPLQSCAVQLAVQTPFMFCVGRGRLN